jgi:hypothetical protein
MERQSFPKADRRTTGEAIWSGRHGGLDSSCHKRSGLASAIHFHFSKADD